MCPSLSVAKLGFALRHTPLACIPERRQIHRYCKLKCWCWILPDPMSYHFCKGAVECSAIVGGNNDLFSALEKEIRIKHKKKAGLLTSFFFDFPLCRE